MVVPKQYRVPIFSIGTMLSGCYELRSLLGAGGMGYVYEAHDHALNRRVAIKVSRPDIKAGTILHEARIMAAFRHSGLPTVYTMGQHEGVDYVVMERLSGQSLAEHMGGSGRVFSEEETRDVLLAVADSLDVLHQATVVHRDLKPGNIMMVPPDRIVVLDFGICDLERFAGGDSLIGTKHYIAPEAVSRAVKPGEAHLADIYALGVIGYQMLCGTPPFPSAGLTESLQKVVSELPPHISELRVDTSPALANLIMDMINPNPGNRPPIAMVKGQLKHMVLTKGSRRQLPKPTGCYPFRVLVVDDEPSIWGIISYVLEDYGYEIVCVSDGKSALEQLDRNHFDLVITDKNMPKMNGLKLVRTVKERSPATDVILITDYSSKATELAAMQMGVGYCLQKPFSVDELAHTVNRIAAKHRARDSHNSLQ